MGLIKCSDCNRMVSDRAEFCPNCGLPGKYLREQPSEITAVDKMKELYNAVISLESDLGSFLKADRYIAEGEIEKFKKIYAQYSNLLKSRGTIESIKKSESKLKLNLLEINKFVDLFNNIDKLFIEHNNWFIEKKLKEYKEYFDGILFKVDKQIKLDIDQRIAVLTDDDYCLLVAGAGAGKTTTMAAKTKYLVEKLNIDPRDIIVISYTNKAIRELKGRINKKLNIPANICTFHSFAFDIVKNNQADIPEVNFSSYKIIFEMLEKAIYKNKKLLRNIVLFMGYYFELPDTVFDFENLEQYHNYKARQTYQTLKSNLNEYIKKVEYVRSKKSITITGEYLRSIQEVQIANFLYLNNIEYEYEKVYDYPIMGAKKKYTPDFYIKQGENTAYIEHYSLSESYTNNIFPKNQIKKYISNINTKRNIHKHYKTTLIETWSAYNDNRSLLRHLKETLEENSFVLKQRDYNQVYKKIVETSKDKYIIKFVIFMMRFIEQYKTSGLNEKGFDFLKKKTDNPRTLLFLDIAEKVYTYYQEKLKKKNQIDFSDMINDANFYLDEIKKQGKRLSYKYIIIDEFQDIAKQRFNLTKKLSQVTNAKVVAVGDDWQSIFAFAGADITLFTRFTELMGGGKELKITRTYRNAQELIDIAGSFIQKNSSQIKKQLISPKSIKEPIRIYMFDDMNKPMVQLADLVTNVVGSIIDEFGSKSSILLIGRYNYDMNKLIRTGKFYFYNKKVRCKKYPKMKIEFLTAHSSKGLGYDNVILINMFEGRYGFPCQIEDDPILKLVIHEDNSILYAEERRLFYVALTRTKNRVHICAPKEKPSRFLIELIKDYNLSHPKGLNMKTVDHFRLRCPICNFPIKYEFNKNYGLHLYMCTNDVEVCDFMTNSKEYKYDIHICPKCEDGYLIVRKNNKKNTPFFGCSNYNNKDNICRYTETINVIANE